MQIRGIDGRPFVDLEPWVDMSALDAIHEEVCLGLAQVPTTYTGGSHRAMGIVPPSRRDECLIDYGEAVRAMSDDHFATLSRLGDEPLDPRRRGDVGEERAQPLSHAQMLWLKMRFGVYFPWKVYVELVPSGSWADKGRARGKRFTRQARAFFPRAVAWIEQLPFTGIGRCTILGLEANDHGTVHHDGDPQRPREPAHFVTLCPRGDKRLFVWNEETQDKSYAPSRVYWFNDQDDHGVDADPFFRYSIRVDGVFEPDFLARLRVGTGGA